MVSGKTYKHFVSQIEEALVITNDMGPFYDDMCLALRFENKDDLFIMSEHRDFQTFLFDQLGNSIKLNYEQIINAASSFENNIFPIYKKL